MPTKTINTEKEIALSNQRKGARRVRAGVQEEINQLLPYYPEGPGREALDKLNEYIVGMIERDKKRKGGLWN